MHDNAAANGGGHVMDGWVRVTCSAGAHTGVPLFVPPQGASQHSRPWEADALLAMREEGRRSDRGCVPETTRGREAEAARLTSTLIHPVPGYCLSNTVTAPV
jgi:hypothetical protein